MSKFEKPKSREPEFDEAEHLLVSGISKQMYAFGEQRIKNNRDDYGDDLERLRELSGFWPVFMNRVIEWNPEKDLEPLAKSHLKDFIENDPEKAAKVLMEIQQVGEIASEELNKPDALRALAHLSKSLAFFNDEGLFLDVQARENIAMSVQEVRNRLQELKGQIAKQK
ncbi:MAG: hypothetical protein A2745_00500 [Candidatus Harrisonbacteria bacterium RIFCSPHIGHO2_01_FULL_44_13]|uniref:Uncharacterized protein n=1 Tax=Candidatus Harrisonbacteria bacterium RIFCSPLOWO2_01_FULL_44_18 TaxID=1798407 RepID=A0A1G1ZL32_9BACT|nr:MAG: hypothetical protein A2745_00500 [Candidatus Harrisonbacteria bacterium RIFCSPHIGHO2_01_FULL_44_13]OGY65302.1 MAG: hypothetical protein A3A16_01830 [Candidatus Harrisonbacteria bacterium RIFCSPLOWO2_01_FULL_44_18]